MKKFELTTESKINRFGKTLFRIKACIDFTTSSGGEIHAGDIGGYVEKESNLSHDGKAWVCGDAEVYGSAEVYDNAEVYGSAKVCGDAEVCGDAKVCGDAEVYDDAKVYGNAKVWDNAEVCRDANIFSTKHFFCITPIDDYANSLMMFRTKHREIKISFERRLYTLDEFNGIIDEWDDVKNREVARAALEVAKMHIDLNPDEKKGVDEKETAR